MLILTINSQLLKQGLTWFKAKLRSILGTKLHVLLELERSTDNTSIQSLTIFIIIIIIIIIIVLIFVTLLTVGLDHVFPKPCQNVLYICYRSKKSKNKKFVTVHHARCVCDVRVTAVITEQQTIK